MAWPPSSSRGLAQAPPPPVLWSRGHTAAPSVPYPPAALCWFCQSCRSNSIPLGWDPTGAVPPWSGPLWWGEGGSGGDRGCGARCSGGGRGQGCHLVRLFSPLASPGTSPGLPPLSVGGCNPPLWFPQIMVSPRAGEPSGEGRRLQVSRACWGRALVLCHPTGAKHRWRCCCAPFRGRAPHCPAPQGRLWAGKGQRVGSGGAEPS